MTIEYVLKEHLSRKQLLHSINIDAKIACIPLFKKILLYQITFKLYNFQIVTISSSCLWTRSILRSNNSVNWKLSQSNSVAAFGFSYESKHIRICSFVHFSTARSDGRLFLSKNLISVVSIFFSNSPPSYLHRTKIFTTP